MTKLCIMSSALSSNVFGSINKPNAKFQAMTPNETPICSCLHGKLCVLVLNTGRKVPLKRSLRPPRY